MLVAAATTLRSCQAVVLDEETKGGSDEGTDDPPNFSSTLYLFIPSSSSRSRKA
jgi:hypothetical protein